MSNSTNYYELLQVKPTATIVEIKEAYRRALLINHPDKRRHENGVKREFDLTLIKEAYRVLSSIALRLDHSVSCSIGDAQSLDYHPAQVVSLDLFEELPGRFQYACRCGNRYAITVPELEQGVHILGCEGCSETIWVAYEVEEES